MDQGFKIVKFETSSYSCLNLKLHMKDGANTLSLNFDVLAFYYVDYYLDANVI